MAYLVLAYPHFTNADLAWIEEIRMEHDPQAALVAPHVTLVFPVPEDQVALDALIAHIRTVAMTTPPFTLVLRCALLMPETGRPGAHLFLVPDEGMSHLVKLHDQLYQDLLAAYLRLDIPFIPHVTVGAGNDAAALYQVARSLNATPFALNARVDQLTVVRHTAGVVTVVNEIALVGVTY